MTPPVVRLSGIHGFGVFSDRSYDVGETILEIDDSRVVDAERPEASCAPNNGVERPAKAARILRTQNACCLSNHLLGGDRSTLLRQIMVVAYLIASIAGRAIEPPPR